MKALAITSATPIPLNCTLEQRGGGYLCRIGEREHHPRAAAVATWLAGRAVTRSFAVDDPRNAAVAVHAAHRLCTASRRRVFCVAGIRYEESDAAAAHITEAAYALAGRIAREVEDQRYARRMRSVHGLLPRIEARASELLPALDAFLARPLSEIVEQYRPTIAADFARHFERKVTLYAPLYLSNACLNDCIYCGFRRSSHRARTTLDREQAVAEAAALARQGHRCIDLVTGEIPTDRFIERVAETLSAIRARTPLDTINLNLGALTLAQYRRLVQAGAEGYHLYQETYDRREYFAVHRAGLKRDMGFRLTGLHRAAQAGFRYLGLGLLLGLRPLREDLAALMAHAQILLEEHPGLSVGFSLPRIREVEGDGEYVARNEVDDETFCKAMLYLRLSFPREHLSLTTREAPALRDRLIGLGVSKVSAGVSTAPGGYADGGSRATAQFSIADRRSLSEMTAVVRRAGLGTFP